MKNVAKKAVIYSMVGLMQVGLFASVAEAAMFNNSSSQQVVQLDSRNGRDHDRDRDNDRRRHEKERRRIHDERKRVENERHEREMKRRPHESRREWRERQERERERHDRELRIIAALLIGIAIGSGSSDN